MYIDPIARDYPQHAELVGLCDASLVRANYHRNRIQQAYGYHDVPVFAAQDFERMVRETAPDTVSVCTMDSTHHEYIVAALNLGCDVITEKPMTTGAAQCRAIFEAVERTGKSVRVAFNYRWMPGASKVRELLASGVVGNIKHVNMEYQLNTAHGADYFRRWHATKACSGGLLVHKSTHHFDLINWWIDGIPSEVSAFGSLQFYGKQNAVARGDAKYTGYHRYTDVPAAKNDPFAITLEGPRKLLYMAAEEESGYIRDRNVFRDDIDIEDTMGVLVRYRNGVLLNYSLVAYSPIEGYRVTFTGDRGRLEYTEIHQTHIISGQSDTELAKEQSLAGGHQMHMRVIPHFEKGYDVEIPTVEGSHGGADPQLQASIYSPDAPEDHLSRSAGHEQGAASILVGVAANRSMQSNQKVHLDDLCPLPANAMHLSDLT
jgi:predicted dehydrogenase